MIAGEAGWWGTWESFCLAEPCGIGKFDPFIKMTISFGIIMIFYTYIWIFPWWTVKSHTQLYPHSSRFYLCAYILQFRAWPTFNSWKGPYTVTILTEYLKNYGRRFATLYRRWWLKPSPRKRMQEGKVVAWGGPKNSWEKKRRAKEEGKDIPIWMQSSRE